MAYNTLENRVIVELLSLEEEQLEKEDPQEKSHRRRFAIAIKSGRIF